MRHLLMTGGHSGIGLELSKRLLKEPDTQLGLVIRSAERKATLAPELLDAPNIEFFYCDLSDQASVRELAETVSTKWEKIDVLFNNAGVLLDQAYYSKQDNEMHFEVNTLAPYLLTDLLRSSLARAGNAVVVNTLTGGLHQRGALDVEDLKRPKKFVKLLGSYVNSKYALLLLTQKKAPEWPEFRIVNVDPGPNKTKMTAGAGMPFWLRPFRSLLFAGPDKGAKKLYDAAFDQQFSGPSGLYVSGNKIKTIKRELNSSELVQLLNAIK